MQIYTSVKSSLHVLANNKLRSGLTMLGIVIGISAVIMISSIGQGAVAYITDELAVFGTNFFRIASGESFFSSFATPSNPLTLEDLEAIEEIENSNIQYVVPIALANRKISSDFDEVSANVFGTTSGLVMIMKPTLVYGDFFSDDDNEGVAKVGIIGIEMAEELFGENTNPVGQFVRVDSTRVKIVGVARSIGGIADLYFKGLIVPINTHRSYLTGKDRIFQMVVSIADEDLLNQTVSDVEVVLRDHRELGEEEENDFFVQSFRETLSTIQSITGLLTVTVSGISAISLIVGGIGVMNIMLVTVTERTKEIGLLKAIGARDNDILVQFLIESVTLTLLGGVVGIMLGIGGAFLASVVAGIPFVVSPVSVVLAIGVSSLVGVVFGLFPARRAARLDPIEALRYE